LTLIQFNNNVNENNIVKLTPVCYCLDFVPEAVDVPSSFNYKEYEIVIDTEVIPKEKPGKKQADELKEFEKLVAEGKAGSLSEYST